MEQADNITNSNSQTEKILEKLCAELKDHDEAFSRQDRSGSFVKKILHRNRKRNSAQQSDASADRDLEFSMEEISFDSAGDSVEYLEYNADPENSLEQSLTESLDDSLNEEEAIEAIISAINRMAMKLDKDPKISLMLKRTGSEDQSSVNFSRFSSLVISLLQETSPGIAVDSWGNAMFFMIMALRVSELKHYPKDFFKRYVYDKIVPWVTQQPEGWISAKYDEKVGNVVKHQASRKPASISITGGRSGSNASDYSDYASSPSSLMNWFSFPR